MNALSIKFGGLALAAALATSAATLLATGAPAAAAEPVAAVRSATVKTADLNLADPAGVRLLNARVRQAAETLCIERGTQTPQLYGAGRACLKNAIANTQPQIAAAIAAQTEVRYAARVEPAAN